MPAGQSAKVHELAAPARVRAQVEQQQRVRHHRHELEWLELEEAWARGAGREEEYEGRRVIITRGPATALLPPPFGGLSLPGNCHPGGGLTEGSHPGKFSFKELQPH